MPVKYINKKQIWKNKKRFLDLRKKQGAWKR